MSKCEFLVFHNKGKKLNFEGEAIIYNLNELGKDNIHSNSIPLELIHNEAQDVASQTYKYLGILLDENFTFNYHVDFIGKKLSKALFCLQRAKSVLNKKALLILYYSTFHSHLLYCSNILGCTSTSNIKRISVLQKKAIRLITLSNYNAHTELLFKQLDILPFDKILHESKMKFMHAIYNNNAPPSFVNIWPKNINRDQQYDLRNQDNFVVPKPRFEGFKKYPLYSFAKTWNESGDLRLYSNFNTFKIALRDQLLGQLVSL